MSPRKGKNKPGNPKKKRVVVNSKTYDIHDRAARGTYKEATLNSTMIEQGQKMLGSNLPAKLIFDALKPFREDFKGGLFWQQLVKYFTRLSQEGLPPGVEGFEIQDINKNYPLSRMMNLNVLVNIDMPSLAMELSVKNKMKPKFLERCPYVNGVQITAIVLFPDFAENDIITTAFVMPVRKVDDQNLYSFIINIPATANSYLLICKAEGCRDGKVCNNGTVTRAMYLKEAKNLL